MISTTRVWRSAAFMVVAGLVLAACGGSDSGDSGGGGGGGGGDTLIISSDLPLQGSSKDAAAAMNNAVKLLLEQAGNKAGKYKIEFKSYDDSTAAKGAYDDATCAKNAQDHVANTNEVAVMGTYNSACAKLEVPVMNQDPDGPMLMVSHANTNPGLTKAWDPGEPDKYYPTGKRNYARVVTTDDFQGTADSNYVFTDLKKKRCFVLNDNTTYGQGVATAFVNNAKKIGLEILGNQPWDPKQPNYTAVFQSIKSKNPDCIFIAGIYDLNGGQLIKDKVKVLGDNKEMMMMGPDGFTGYPDLLKQKEAEGMYLSFSGLPTESLRKNGGAAADFLDAYKEKYGTDPPTNYALYAAAATQVILAAIEKSDGTRKGVNDAVFSGAGITIPQDVSVIGKEIIIDPKSGDTNNKDISIELVKGGVETFVKAQPVE